METPALSAAVSPAPTAEQEEPAIAETSSITPAKALAPMSILYRAGHPDEIPDPPYMLFEADQVGNVHILIHWDDEEEEDEAYVVDGIVYFRDSGLGEADFAVVEDPETLDLLAAPFDRFSVQEGTRDIISKLPLHAILWAGAYQSVEELGPETVNGYSTDKYRLVIDPQELRKFTDQHSIYRRVYDALVLDEDGAAVYVWVEPNSRAVVKAEWRITLNERPTLSTLEVTPLGDTVFEPPSVSE